ncbi:hypothetical protein HY483_02775 [Candidatus Woesearchaeota archaeon]|nr:hypothetical protein [Candidatus Woesearchaeota archaeon]
MVELKWEDSSDMTPERVDYWNRRNNFEDVWSCVLHQLMDESRLSFDVDFQLLQSDRCVGILSTRFPDRDELSPVKPYSARFLIVYERSGSNGINCYLQRCDGEISNPGIIVLDKFLSPLELAVTFWAHSVSDEYLKS